MDKNTPARKRWLVAMSAACGDRTAESNAAVICNLGIDKLVLNSWVPAARCSGSHVLTLPKRCQTEHHFIPGMVGQFWKDVLTPMAVRGYDIVWLIDDDVRPVLPPPSQACYL